MKVVLFCGGLGTRLRDYSESIPKPMVNIGYRPIIWHLMKYYAHYGHTDFILCLGYRGDVIKQYFLNYEECLSNDFVLSKGGKELTLYGRDIENWNITFVDSGLYSNIGQRLKAVATYLQGDAVFLANYTDGLSDLPLNEHLDNFTRRDAIASFISVRPNHTFHLVNIADNTVVRDISHVSQADLWMNGGFFAFRREIFDYIGDGEELVEEPFARLIQKGALVAYKHNGFWACMDTFKDKQRLDDLNAQGDCPWEVWRRGPSAQAPVNGGAQHARVGAHRPEVSEKQRPVVPRS